MGILQEQNLMIEVEVKEAAVDTKKLAAIIDTLIEESQTPSLTEEIKQ